MIAKRSFTRARRLLYCLILLIGYSLIFVQHLFRRHQNRLTTDFDTDVLSTWTNHIESFPIQSRDRYAMHEMGFRTSIYSQLIEKLDREQSDQVSRLHFALWDFLPMFGENKEQMTEKRDFSSSAGRNSFYHKLKNLAKFRSIGQQKKRGLVTVIDANEARSVVELITTLRYSLKDDINVEIVHYGDENLPELIREALSLMPNVRTIDLNNLPLFGDGFIDSMGLQNMTHMRSMALQSLALLVSDFDEVIYAAPGTLFLEKPEILLEQPDFKRTGTYFFHGLNTPQLADSNRFLNYLRQQFDQALPSKTLAASPFYNFGTDKYQDPRVLAIDKSRPNVFSAILLNVWLHTPQIRDAIWHAHFPQCLTETVWLSFELSKVPYYFEPAFAGAIGQFDGPIEDLPWQPMICPAHALHFVGRKSYASRGGKPVWMDGGLKLFPHHEKYLDIQAWSPRGRWEQTNLGMCLIGADAHTPEEHGLASRLNEHKIIDETFIDIFSTIFDVYGLSSL